jgi:hypothetical protein
VEERNKLKKISRNVLVLCYEQEEVISLMGRSESRCLSDTAIPSSSHRIPFRIAKLSFTGPFSTGVGDHLGSSWCCIYLLFLPLKTPSPFLNTRLGMNKFLPVCVLCASFTELSQQKAKRHPGSSPSTKRSDPPPMSHH